MANPNDFKCTLANGAMLTAPIYETHHRGSNWLAVIDIDATMPGGLNRRFMNRGKGECMYLVEQVGLFDPVEFGADYTTSVGTKKRDRWYGVVTAKTDDFLLVEQCASGAKAVLRAKVLRTSTEALVAALKHEQQSLISRAARVEEQILELEAAPAGVFTGNPELSTLHQTLLDDADAAVATYRAFECAFCGGIVRGAPDCCSSRIGERKCEPRERELGAHGDG